MASGCQTVSCAGSSLRYPLFACSIPHTEVGREADKTIKGHQRYTVAAACAQDLSQKSFHEWLGVLHLKFSPLGPQAPPMYQVLIAHLSPLSSQLPLHALQCNVKSNSSKWRAIMKIDKGLCAKKKLQTWTTALLSIKPRMQKKPQIQQ